MDVQSRARPGVDTCSSLGRDRSGVPWSQAKRQGWHFSAPNLLAGRSEVRSESLAAFHRHVPSSLGSVRPSEVVIAKVLARNSIRENWPMIPSQGGERGSQAESLPREGNQCDWIYKSLLFDDVPVLDPR